MTRRRGRSVPAAAPEPRARHDYPPGWRSDDWLVPFNGGSACIHHGHTDPDDHSLCGPATFCCRRAAARYVALFPDSWEATATWELTETAHLLGWIQKDVHLFYFVFCHPARPEGLLATGLAGELLPAILRWHIGLDDYAAQADRLL